MGLHIVGRWVENAQHDDCERNLGSRLFHCDVGYVVGDDVSDDATKRGAHDSYVCLAKPSKIRWINWCRPGIYDRLCVVVGSLQRIGHAPTMEPRKNRVSVINDGVNQRGSRSLVIDCRWHLATYPVETRVPSPLPVAI